MAKVFGMHMISLLPGVKSEDFEKFVVEEMYPLPLFEGWKYYLYKGDRGDREGRYLAVFEFNSVELRDQLFPAPGDVSEKVQQMLGSHAAVFEKWSTFAPPMDVTSTDNYTDYFVVGKQTLPSYETPLALNGGDLGNESKHSLSPEVRQIARSGSAFKNRWRVVPTRTEGRAYTYLSRACDPVYTSLGA